MTLMPEVRQELRATAARRAAVGHAADRRLLGARLPRLGRGLGLAAAVVCPVLVVALVIAGSHRPAVPDTAGAPHSISALTERLAVLRRPQNAADRTLPSGLLGDEATTGLALDRRLVRLLAVMPTRAIGNCSDVFDRAAGQTPARPDIYGSGSTGHGRGVAIRDYRPGRRRPPRVYGDQAGLGRASR